MFLKLIQASLKVEWLHLTLAIGSPRSTSRLNTRVVLKLELLQLVFNTSKITRDTHRNLMIVSSRDSYLKKEWWTQGKSLDRRLLNQEFTYLAKRWSSAGTKSLSLRVTGSRRSRKGKVVAQPPFSRTSKSWQVHLEYSRCSTWLALRTELVYSPQIFILAQIRWERTRMRECPWAISKSLVTGIARSAAERTRTTVDMFLKPSKMLTPKMTRRRLRPRSKVKLSSIGLSKSLMKTNRKLSVQELKRETGRLSKHVSLRASQKCSNI